MKKLSAFITLILLTGASVAAHAAEWNSAIDAAIKWNNYNQINIIAASNPAAQGDIALYLLQQSQNYRSDPQREVRIFVAATPFVGRIPAANTAEAADIIDAALRIAANKDFQTQNPRGAADIFLNALFMSGQPNIVANDPNLHAEVLEAADDFVKEHPQDADKRLMDEVELAEAGGAPETAPAGVINPSGD